MTTVALEPSALDAIVGPVEHVVDDRWLIAYAAGVHDRSPALTDVDRPGGVVAHPVFPVCVEWPLVARGTPGVMGIEEIAHTGVHVGHALELHRPIRAGDRLRTSARLLAVDQRSIGVYALVVFTTVDAEGSSVVETRHETIYLGGQLQDSARAASAAQPGAGLRAHSSIAATGAGRGRAATGDAPTVCGGFDVGEGDAVIYTECARIWNPIHTDPRVARAAGLPGPILHGTATLARAVSLIVAEHLDGDPTRVFGLGCRFTGMVSLGSRVEVASARSGGRIDFVARGTHDEPVLDAGFVEVEPQQAR